MRLLFIWLLVVGCSFKPPEEKGGKSSSNLTLDLSLVDSDGDGILDFQEKEDGTDPFIADIPTFDGELFQELRVSTTLFRRIDNKEETVFFQVKKGSVLENGTQIENRDFLRRGSLFPIEKGALLARKSGFAGTGHLTTNLEASSFELYSPPRMNDSKIFPYSERLKSLASSYEYEEINLTIANHLLISSKRFGFYSNVWMDLYYYDSYEQKFIEVGSSQLLGPYDFNRSYTVGLKFRSNNKAIVKAISETGGRHLYLKIRDFEIDSEKRRFKNILEKVIKKSVPVIISNQDGYLVRYIGINGKPSGLKEILSKATKEEIKLLSGNLVGIGPQTNNSTLEVGPYGESSIIERKWFVTTNEISNSPTVYSFSPGEPVVISYFSESDPFDLIPSYFSNYASSEKAGNLKIFDTLARNLIDLRLSIKPIKYHGKSNRVKTAADCNVSATSSLCFYYNIETLDLKGLSASPVFSIIEIKLNNKTYRLDELLASKMASFRTKNTDTFEIKFNRSILKELKNSAGVTVAISSIKPNTTVCDGIKYCEDNGKGCQTQFAAPPICTKGSTVGSGYRLIDNTTKSQFPIIGELFLTVEYI